MTVHLDRGYDPDATRRQLDERGLIGVISDRGKPAPLVATKRWVVERTNSWHNAREKQVWCTERRGRVIDFWIAFSEVVIIVSPSSEKPGLTTAGKADLGAPAMTCWRKL